MQEPLHSFPDCTAVVPTGTEGSQLGVEGPLIQWTPCGVVELAFVKTTVPPGSIVAAGGFQ